MASRKKLLVWTAHRDYPGDSRIDISKGPFGPPTNIDPNEDWELFVDTYWKMMRVSYKNNAIWKVILDSNKVVFTCSCQSNARCHRSILAKIFVKLGAVYMGEITEWDSTIEEPIYSRFVPK